MARRVAVRLDDCAHLAVSLVTSERAGGRGENALAEMPCLVTERNECDDAAAPIASIAIWSEPSVPFLKPTASGRWRAGGVSR